jgi:fatty acid desaturase
MDGQFTAREEKMEEIKLPARAEFPAELCHVSTTRALSSIAFDWMVIAAVIGAALKYPGILTFVAAQLLVASRQHALFASMHEGVHYLITKNKPWNDRISDFLAAWPVGFSTERYRLRHWTHHRYLNSDKDPDWVRKKIDPSWQVPMPMGHFWVATLAHMFGKGLLEMYGAWRIFGVAKADLPVAIPYYGLIALTLTWVGGWKAFALYWLLPYVTVMPFLHRIRSLAEHLATPKTNLLNGTRNIFASPLESFFFGPRNQNLHLVHHVFPFVPAHKLYEAHEFLLTHPSYREHALKSESYFLPAKRSVYSDMIQRESTRGEERDSRSKKVA